MRCARRRRLLGALVLLAALGARADTTGRVEVAVADEGGSPLARVRVGLEVPATGLEREATTDEAGRALFVGLPSGEAILRFELDGFQILEKNAKVTVGAPARVHATLDRKRRAAELYNAAVADYEAGRPAHSRAAIARALEFDPALGAAHALEARLASEAGDASGAAGAYLRAFEIDPSLEDRHLSDLVVVLQRAGRDAEAARYASRLESKRAPTEAELYDLAVLAINRADDAAALRHLERLLEADPRHAPATYQKALVHLRAGDAPRALDGLRRYLDLAPDGEFAADARSLLETLSSP